MEANLTLIDMARAAKKQDDTIKMRRRKLCNDTRLHSFIDFDTNFNIIIEKKIVRQHKIMIEL